MALRSQISRIVANQLGNIQGQVEARIITEAVKLTEQFASGCPNQDKLIKIIKARNNLLKSLNNFQRLANRLGSIPSKLRPAISSAKTIIRIIKRNPTPLAIGVKPAKDFGGLISARSAGFVTSQADRLVKVNLLLDALEGDLSAVTSLLKGINPTLNNLRQVLDNVNISIQDCVDNLTEQDADSAKELINAVRPLENTGSEGTPDESFEYVAANGRPYFLSIENFRSDTDIAQRRVAIAKDLTGATVLKGSPSFSSDTQILLEELKFRLDNQLA